MQAIFLVAHDGRSLKLPAGVELKYKTGRRPTVTRRDPIYEIEPILDQEGNVTDHGKRVLKGWSEPYQIKVDESAGGYQLLGRVQKNPPVAAVLINSSKAIVEQLKETDGFVWIAEVSRGKG